MNQPQKQNEEWIWQWDIVCMCVCVCVYIYIYIYIYTHTYMKRKTIWKNQTDMFCYKDTFFKNLANFVPNHMHKYIYIYIPKLSAEAGCNTRSIFLSGV